MRECHSDLFSQEAEKNNSLRPNDKYLFLFLLKKIPKRVPQIFSVSTLNAL